MPSVCAGTDSGWPIGVPLLVTVNVCGGCVRIAPCESANPIVRRAGCAGRNALGSENVTIVRSDFFVPPLLHAASATAAAEPARNARRVIASCTGRTYRRPDAGRQSPPLRRRRPRRGGRRRRRVVAGGAARPSRRARTEGRVQPAGAVRLLHGARRR